MCAQAPGGSWSLAGRVLASQVGPHTAATATWTCSAFDARGRTTQVRHEVDGATAGNAGKRTVTYDHAVGGDPLTSSVSDSAGTVTTRVDLLGRVLVYTDVHGLTTSTDYDQAGRAHTLTTGRTAGGTVLSTQQFAFDSGGRLSQQRFNGQLIAVPSYNSAGEVATVDYPASSTAGQAGNGTSGALTRDGGGRLSSRCAGICPPDR